MAEPSNLHNSRVTSPELELATATILEDAAAPGEEVSCTLEVDGPNIRTDPMRWTPYVTPEGFFYPKRDDEALVALPADGPPWIVAWAPAPGAVPDVLA
jgi:hypothetical protein